MAKKRKVGEEPEDVPAKPDGNDPDVEEDLTKLLEPFSKEQLIDLLRSAASIDPKILEEIHQVADQDPAHRKLFVHGLGWETTSEKLREFFSQYGELEDCNVVADKVTGKSKGYGFLLFKHRRDAQKALKEPQKKIESRMTACQLATIGPVNPSQSNPNMQQQQIHPSQHPSQDNLPRKIYVGNVHSDIPADRLFVFFSKYGEIEEGPLGFDKLTGKSKGFALFVYKTIEGARKALEEPNKSFEGHQLYCQKATDSHKSKSAAAPSVSGNAPGTGGFNAPGGGGFNMQGVTGFGAPGGAGFNAPNGAMGHQASAASAALLGQGDLALAWASVYALWLHPNHREDDLIAISVDSEHVGEYMRCTGLGVISPYSPSATSKNAIYWLYREAFWQGAGAPDSQHWLQSRPETTKFPGFNGTLGVFASQMGFTRNGNVCTVHPVRPPKPQPGAVIYSRFIVELGQQLQIRHIDAENPLHFETYKRWQNSDRVNASWKERGPDEHHRAYLAGQLADPHSMSCVFEWDGELAGYTELGWVKEDNAACFFSSNCNIVVGEHDQNSHILVGEEHFRGGKRYQAVATSIKHCCFLRDPRTRQVIAEPRYDLSHVQIQDRFLPQEKKKRFHLPHKTAMLFALQRDRFFQDAHLV